MSKYMLCLHEVADYAKWKPIFDSSKKLREENGLTKDVSVLREKKDKSEVVLLFEVNDMAKANAFSQSNAFKELMKKAGVISTPEIYFLSNGRS